MTRQPYSYIADNPLSGVDPLGLCDWNPFGHNSCAGIIATGLSQLPGAIANDVKQGQENFIKNVQDPKLRPLVIVGTVALAGAAAIATGGLLLAAGPGGLAGQVGAMSTTGRAIATSIVVTIIAIAARACTDPTRRASQNPPPADDPNVVKPNLFPPSPSPTYGPPIPTP